MGAGGPPGVGKAHPDGDRAPDAARLAQAPGQAYFDRAVADNPHVRFASGEHRGYLRVEIGAARATVDLRAMESVTRPDAACRTLATFVVEDGAHAAVQA